MKRCILTISIILVALALSGCGAGEQIKEKPGAVTGGNEIVVGEDIALEDITEFYWTYSTSTNPPEYQRYYFSEDDGKYLFYHEKREGDSFPLTEDDITIFGTVELTEDEWVVFCDYVKEGRVQAREESSGAGGSGPWMFLYWNGDEDIYQEYSFASQDQEAAFEQFCMDLMDSESSGTNTGRSDQPESSQAEFDLQKGTALLNSGYEMPVIGCGMWTLTLEEAADSTYYALKSGMRLIDTARYYQNESGVGEGLQRAINEGIVSREEVFITSKIYGGNYESAGEAIDDSLNELGVEYLDLMLIHQPGADDEGVYKAMEDAVRDGKIRSIGISNYYTPEQVDEVLAFAEITPAVIQNENHIYYQNAELRDYVKQYGIVMESWYPFGGRGHTQDSFENETIQTIADIHEKTPAQVILRWHLQDGYIAIPGSSNSDHIAENFDLFDFELTEDEMNQIRAIDRQERYEHW